MALFFGRFPVMITAFVVRPCKANVPVVVTQCRGLKFKGVKHFKSSTPGNFRKRKPGYYGLHYRCGPLDSSTSPYPFPFRHPADQGEPLGTPKTNS